jgi:hypothetical protein
VYTVTAARNVLELAYMRQADVNVCARHSVTVIVL